MGNRPVRRRQPEHAALAPADGDAALNLLALTALLMVLMGHAKIETTLKHYVHLEGEDARAIIDRVGGF